MKVKFICAFFVFLPLISEGQTWEILNTELIAEKKGEQLSLSYIDGRRSLMVDADSAFLDERGTVLLFTKGEYFGVVDPVNLVLLSDPVFRSVRAFHDYYLVEDSEGYYMVNMDDFANAVSDNFADFQSFCPDNVDLASGRPILVLNKGRYGIIKDWKPSVMEVEADYDEISFKEIFNDDYVYFLRKGDFWGAGGCEGVEIEAKYDQLELLYGECSNHTFLAAKNGKYGLVKSGQKKPLVDFDYDKIKVLKDDLQSWFFMFDEGNLVAFINAEPWSGYTDVYAVERIVYVAEIEKTYIVYSLRGEQLKLVLPQGFHSELNISPDMANVIFLD